MGAIGGLMMASGIRWGLVWGLLKAIQCAWASRGCLRLTWGLYEGYLEQKSKQNFIILILMRTKNC